jgi:hypothetical protein
MFGFVSRQVKWYIEKTKDERTANGHLLITAEVIENARTDKRGISFPELIW